MYYTKHIRPQRTVFRAGLWRRCWGIHYLCAVSGYFCTNNKGGLDLNFCLWLAFAFLAIFFFQICLLAIKLLNIFARISPFPRASWGTDSLLWLLPKRGASRFVLYRYDYGSYSLKINPKPCGIYALYSLLHFNLVVPVTHSWPKKFGGNNAEPRS